MDKISYVKQIKYKSLKRRSYKANVSFLMTLLQ